jgi:hypothetical protein
MNQLIRCIKCDEIFLKTPFDLWPEYAPSQVPSMDSFRTIPKDDFEDFLSNHRGHQLEDLKIVEDSFVSEKDYSEPVKTSYFKATNGKESFLIKKSREQISEAIKYEMVSADLLLKCTGIQIQAEEIEKQMERELELPKQKIAAFVKVYRRIVDRMEIENLERVPEESPNPLEVYYKMDDISLAFLLRNCRNMFKGQQYLAIERFIEGHKEGGVLLVKASFQILISEKGKSRIKIPPPALLVESRKSLKKEEP